jgi:3-hydroxy-9,10-secoandrosta-1,3,5(10)-triene-9,17-dione monooxygenase
VASTPRLVHVWRHRRQRRGECPRVSGQGDYKIRHVAGLRGSKDVEVKEVFVPAHRALTVEQMKGGVALGGEQSPLYRLPVFDMFPYVVAGAALGIAKGAIEVFTEDIRHRITAYSTTLLADYATTQARLGHAAAAIAAAERTDRQLP